MSDDEEAVLSRLFVETQAATIAELSPTRKPKKQAKRTKAKGKKGSLKGLDSAAAGRECGVRAVPIAAAGRDGRARGV